MKGRRMLLGFVALSCCGGPPHGDPLSSSAVANSEWGEPTSESASPNWSRDTRSPSHGAVPEALARYGEICGEWDTRLAQVAAWLANRGSVGERSDDLDRLTVALRAAGIPYVWPAAWSRLLKYGDDDTLAIEAFGSWLRNLEPETMRRCGLARHDAGGRTTMVAVVATALADLDRPIPARTRIGAWLEFEATLRVPATQAKVILLSPMGEPMAVPTQQSGSKVRARFAAAHRGRWLVQLMASGDTGPRPMLEAMLFVDVAPSADDATPTVPGTQALQGGESPEEALHRMVTAMRQLTGRPPMRRDPDLDRVALAHADAMYRARRIGHDVGDGSTDERLAAAGVRARLTGENVAHAPSAERAHRALWASPSHRYNLLHRGFGRWGLGVVRDADGSLWVCELFASDR